jgi:hypothetical protein
MKHFIAIQKRAGAPTQPQRWWSMRVNLAVYAALVLVLFLGVIESASRRLVNVGQADRER